MNTILGVITNKNMQSQFTLKNERSNHLSKDRSHRVDLVNWNAKPVYYFDVARGKTSWRQVHLILEDATLVVFNTFSKEIITVVLLKPSGLERYLSHVRLTKNKSRLEKRLLKNAKVNQCLPSKEKNITDKMIEKYIRKKSKIQGVEKMTKKEFLKFLENKSGHGLTDDTGKQHYNFVYYDDYGVIEIILEEPGEWITLYEVIKVDYDKLYDKYSKTMLETLTNEMLIEMAKESQYE